MPEDIPRSIRFPKELWDAIDRDAERCKRSSVRQMEAVLSAYYELEDVDVNAPQLEIVGELFRKSKTKTPLIEVDADDGSSAKKKRRA